MHLMEKCHFAKKYIHLQQERAFETGFKPKTFWSWGKDGSTKLCPKWTALGMSSVTNVNVRMMNKWSDHSCGKSSVSLIARLGIGEKYCKTYCPTLASVKLFKNMGQIRSLLYMLDLFLNTGTNSENWLLKHRWCSWVSNPGPLDGRHRRVH